jgi:diguanylate cyclase (GGDEF)-like protein
MFNKLLIKEAYRDIEFEHHINTINAKRGSLYGKIIFILEVIMLSLSFISPDFFQVESLKIYRVHFFSLMVYAGIMVFISKYYQKKYIKLYRPMMNLTVFFGLLWGASISVLDLKAGGTMSVYLTFVFMLSMAILTRPDFSFLHYIIVQIVFILGISDLVRYVEVILNSSIFILFAWTVARQQYQITYNQFLKDKIINDNHNELEARNKDLVRLSTTDHLTGLFNRYSMDGILKEVWQSCYKKQKNVIVLMIDIDYFKKFNDTYGHVIGDACIVAVADILNKVSDAFEGFAFRYGGDEFCMLFASDDPKPILKAIHDATDHMPIYYKKEKVPVSLSIGYSSDVPSQHTDPWHAIDLADKALYQVKSKRNRRKEDI